MPRVLIVDDDENNRAVAVDALDGEEYELSEAVDGHDCLQKMAHDSFDLILLDVMMPGIDGIETLRQLKAKEETRDVPVIMVTALNMDSQIAACLDEGAIDHVSKPFSNMVLRARVRAALRCSEGNSAARLAERKQRGTVLALVGAKGGVGTSTLAINIAAKLAQNGNSATVCQLQPYAASLADQLAIDPRHHAADLWSGEASHISRRKVEQYLLKHRGGFSVMFGPSESDGEAPASTEDVAELLLKLREFVQYTILDTGIGHCEASREALRQADQVVLVLELDPCALLAAERKLKHLEDLGIAPGAVGAVINNRVQLPLPGVGLNEVREQLNCDLLGLIPANPEGCLSAIKLASPLVFSHPESTTSGAINSLVNRLCAERVNAMFV